MRQLPPTAHPRHTLFEPTDETPGLPLHGQFDTYLMIHLFFLLKGWIQCRTGDKINPTNVSYAMHLGD
ncbi:hypothetical protein QYS36_20890 [Pseudomonas sp. G34]|nr:hypothetical protein [Pseudomonas sp. G34]